MSSIYSLPNELLVTIIETIKNNAKCEFDEKLKRISREMKMFENMFDPVFSYCCHSNCKEFRIYSRSKGFHLIDDVGDGEDDFEQCQEDDCDNEYCDNHLECNTTKTISKETGYDVYARETRFEVYVCNECNGSKINEEEEEEEDELSFTTKFILSTINRMKLFTGGEYVVGGTNYKLYNLDQTQLLQLLYLANIEVVMTKLFYFLPTIHEHKQFYDKLGDICIFTCNEAECDVCEIHTNEYEFRDENNGGLVTCSQCKNHCVFYCAFHANKYLFAVPDNTKSESDDSDDELLCAFHWREKYPDFK